MKSLLFTLLILSCLSVQAQNADYWQQRVDTKIEVRLDDIAHFLHGHIQLIYHNQSPDTLSFLYIHLYPNAYSTDRSAFAQQDVENGHTDFYFSKKEDRGFIDSLNFERTNQKRDIKLGVVHTEHPDIIKLILDQPLFPGDSAEIATPFRVKIPKVFSRMGHSGQAYYISQWFPKPAVYDAQGWHPYPYLGQGEFYSEFGSYEVAITLPQNYVLMATGNLSDAKEQQWLDSLASLSLPSDTLYQNSSPTSSTQLKTVHFTEDRIHDFAWFADKRWVVRKDNITTAQGPVEAYSCFVPKSQKAWANSLLSLSSTVEYLTEKVGPYPYKTIKAVEGLLIAGGAMEYPTITLVGTNPSAESIHTMIVHEAGHNWFYGILGSNERLYPWMDESINSFFENKLAPDTGTTTKLFGGVDLYRLVYGMQAANNQTAAANRPAVEFTHTQYGTDVYGKGAFYFDWLAAYMGATAFQSAMQEYYNTWRFKHPQPSDFEVIFRKHSPKDLNWFFKELMPSERPIDFSIGRVTRSKEQMQVVLKNKSGLNLPLEVVREVEGIPVETQWTEPFGGKTTLNFSGTEGRLRISDAITDYNLTNNSEKRPLRIRPFWGSNTKPGKVLAVLPALGYNVYDRFMLGLAFHNLSIPKNKFQFAWAPMYAFGSKTITGTGFMGYSFYPKDGWLHSWHIRLSGKTFSYDRNNLNIPEYLYKRFIKVAPELVFTLKEPYNRSPVKRELSLKAYWIREGQLNFQQDPIDSFYRPSPAAALDHYYGRIQYQHQNQRTFNPFDYMLEAQLGKTFAKISLSGNLRIDYHLKNKALHVRAFAGKFFNLSSSAFAAYRYQLTQSFTGVNDYLYEDTYLGRSASQGFASQQISMREGGFKINTLQYANPLGFSDDWLFTVNLSSDIPVAWLPFRMYFDLGYNTSELMNVQSNLLYSAGLEFRVTDYFSLYVPILMSPEYREYQQAVFPKNRFWHSLSFKLDLNRIDWYNIGDLLIGH